jgi:hypothetical protein
MKAITMFEYDAFCKTLSGPACILVHDGDYDRAVVWPTGRAVPDWEYNDTMEGN